MIHMKSILENISHADLFQKVGAICAAVNKVTNSKDLLEDSLKQIMDLFNARRGSIFLLNDCGKRLHLKAAQGIADSEKGDLVKQLGEGVVGRVAEMKTPIFVDDIERDERFPDAKSKEQYNSPSFICAPLMIKDHLIGVINITDKETGHRFTQDEMQLLDFLTTQIALNYRRIELYNKFKNVLKETEDLKSQLGKTDQEAKDLKQQVEVHEKLATIGKLAGGIAHEFNNPLDGVMRYTNLCIENTKEDDITRGYLLEIKQGLNRMANIVKNLLACSRDEYLHQEKITFGEAVNRSLTALEPVMFPRNITVEEDIEEGLPAILDLGVERVLTNLIRNAVDAMDDGGEIRIKGRQEAGNLVIEVNDTGPGIPADTVRKIFEPFFTTKDIDKGCGLGLTIVNEIVKSYDGNIKVESEEGQGTTFIITFPIEKIT